MSFFTFAEEEIQMFETGLVIKRARGGGIERIRPAALRDASVDIEGHYLKVDLGDDAQGHPVQIYLYLNPYDVVRIVTEWGKCLEEERMKEITDKRGLRDIGLNILVVTFDDDETYQAIVKEAETLGVAPAELVQQVVVDWCKKIEEGA